MNQQLQLNIIPFNSKVTELTLPFYLGYKEGLFGLEVDDNVKEMIGNRMSKLEFIENPRIYTDFESPKENAILLNLTLQNQTYLFLHYYRYLIFNHFKNVADIMHHNFIGESTVRMHDPSLSNCSINVYHEYTIKVQNAKVTSQPELLISYDGISEVYAKSVAELYNCNTNDLNWIVCNRTLYKWADRPQHVINTPDKCYAVLNKKLLTIFGIKSSPPKAENRYPKHFSYINDFYTKYLKTDSFAELFTLDAKGFYSPNSDQISIINSSLNDLLYSGGKTGREPKKDFKYKGPYQLPSKPSNFKFFFIYQASDKAGAVTELYKYFNSGWKDDKFPFPKMQDYIKVPFELDISKNIEFDTVENAVAKVKQSIRNTEWLSDTRYLALFVNPVPLNEANENRKNIYYQIKEMLLFEGVLSQVIKSEHLYKNGKPNSFFNTFLPHIEIAILAKLGGIPWRINTPMTNELIVGVGAFKSSKSNTRYIGSAFCFNNEGMFKGFDCFKSTDTLSLAGSIREAVAKFIAVHYSASRLILHFYKQMSKKELKPIVDTLHTLGLSIPVIIITINKTQSRELIAFDTQDKTNLMPYSGTYIKVGANEYLLFNNTRFDATSKPAAKEYSFPIKLKLSSTSDTLLEDTALVSSLIEQVFQFSRMYWKSTNHHSIPVTIEYPEMVAKVQPYFKFERLPDFGRENLWFL